MIIPSLHTQFMETLKDYKVNRYFLLGIILMFAIFLFVSLVQFFSAFLAAITLYVLSRPLVEMLIKRWRWRKNLAAILVIVLSFFIILLPITLLGTMMYNKVAGVVNHPDAVINTIKKFDSHLQEQFHISLISDKTLESVKSYVSVLITTILNQGLSFFSGIIMMYFFLYFLLTNINRTEAAIVFYLPFKREKIDMFGKELVAQTFSNAVGVPLIAVAQGSLGFIAYLITGVEEPGFWAVITGFSSVLPIVGAGFVWIPVAAFLLLSGATWQGVFMIGWGAIMMGSIDNVIRFVLAKRMADVHPIVTVLGVIIGLRYFGITGLIFGPLIISYFMILLKIYYIEYQKPPAAKPAKARPLIPAYMQPFLGIKKAKRD